MSIQHRKITSHCLFEMKTPTASPVLIKEFRTGPGATKMMSHMKAQYPNRRYEIRTFEWAYNVELTEKV